MKTPTAARRVAPPRLLRYIGTTAALAMVTGCSDMACTTELRGVIQLRILDSATHAPNAAGAIVRLLGPYSDLITVPDRETSALVHTWSKDVIKPGVYSLVITKPSYHEWSRTGVRVSADACHVTTQYQFTALLHP